jgi:predicted ester cyclase
MTGSRRLVELWYHRMWNEWDMSMLPEIVHPDATFRGSLGRTMKGHAEIMDYICQVRRAFPDFHNKIEETISEGDKMFARLMYTGTHRGEIFSVEPTGRSIAYAGAAVFAFYGEKIKEIWVLGDVYGLLRQLKGEQ